VDFKDTIFAKDEADEEDSDEGGGEKSLGFGEFMEVVLNLRGGNTATVKDMTELRKYINQRFDSLEKRFSHHGYHRSQSAKPGGLYPSRSMSTWAQQMSEEMERTTTPGAQMQQSGTGIMSRTFTHGAFYDSSRSNTPGYFTPSSRATTPARVLSPNSRGSMHVGHHQSTRFQDLVNDAQRALLRAHELEVASLRRENTHLLEQLEQHGRLRSQLDNDLGNGHQTPKYDSANSRQSHLTPNGNNSPNDMDDRSAYLVGSGRSLKSQNYPLNGIHGDKVTPREAETVGVNPDGHAAPVVDVDESCCQQVMGAVGMDPDGDFDDPVMRGGATLPVRAFTPSFSLGGGDAASTSDETRCQEADLRKIQNMQERFEKRAGVITQRRLYKIAGN